MRIDMGAEIRWGRVPHARWKALVEAVERSARHTYSRALDMPSAAPMNEARALADIFELIAAAPGSRWLVEKVRWKVRWRVRWKARWNVRWNVR